jgi:hypothetical protein
MKSVAQYGLICVLFMVLMGCGKSDEDVAKLKKEMEDLKSSTTQMAKEREDLRKQIAEQQKRIEPEKPSQPEPTKPDTPAVEPGKTKPADPQPEKTQQQSSETPAPQQTDRDSGKETPKPQKIVSESPSAKKQTEEKISDKSVMKSQMCDAIDKFLKNVDSAHAIENEAKRKSKMDAALDEVLDARSRLLASKDLREISSKVYVAAYGVKLNAETVARLRDRSVGDTEKFVEAMGKYGKELKSLCSGW